MKIIVFDTETSGLPMGGFIPTIVQFSYVKYNTETNEIEKEVDSIIKQPTDYIIPKESIRIHHITNEMCADRGVEVLPILHQFIEDTKDCERIVGHNISFDMDRLTSVYRKMADGHPDPAVREHYVREIQYIVDHMRPKTYCTMRRSVDFCNIVRINVRGNKYKKVPKLVELYEKIFDYRPDGLHNSLVDVYACLLCYIILVYGTTTTMDIKREIVNRMNVIQNSIEDQIT